MTIHLKVRQWGVMPLLKINSECRVSRVHLFDDHFAVVVDDVLADPETVVGWAEENLARFRRNPAFQFPGPELPLTDEDTQVLVGLIRQRLKNELGISRLVGDSFCRLSMVTFRPEALSWRQTMCHTDASSNVGAMHTLASVLYLFRNAALGGTAVYSQRPGKDIKAFTRALEQGSAHERQQLLRANPVFASKQPCYLTESNELVQRERILEPRWNRMILYDGRIPHTSHIVSPELLVFDARRGRLTLNGFFQVRSFL